MFGHLADTLGARTVEQKLFQYALKPFAVMAFFTRAMTAPAEGAISIATLIDPSRYQRLSTLARAWNGHLSVALHLRPDEVDRQVAKLGQLIQSDAAIRDKCDIHLVITPHPRQLNLMRNVARLYSRTDLVVQLDADFVATTDVARHVDELGFRSRLEAGEIALVIPAFEWADDSVPGISHDPRDPGRTDPSLSSWPTTKREVVSHFQNSRLLVFHHQWAVGHGATDYQRWLAADEPYELDGEHHHSFEPYLVMRRDYDGSGMPYCDERLVGYGGNKAACVFEGHLGGVKLIVLPNDWVIHQRHSYPELERRSERSYNRRLYENIREEMCVRYNRMQTVDDAADGSVGEEDSIGCTRHCGPARKGGERKKK
ncbi:glycosyl-transferase for dystroglycan-domain-containing protein [Hyaloraphidium curvatum]|nr:glycosyl-transferase for dystroglycan-domain-containing protein [Hyaloraphidium curvatum]